MRSTTLRNALASTATCRRLVAHGASDLVTPISEASSSSTSFRCSAPPTALKLTVYGGGPQFYSRDASRRAFREDAQGAVPAALQKE